MIATTARRRPDWKALGTVAFVCAAGAFALAGVVALRQGADGPAKDLPVLTTVRQAHSLTDKQASLAYPVRIRGVVTFYDPYQKGRPALFIADETGGIFVGSPGRALSMEAGSVVEIFGFTDPGGFSPIVVARELRILGGREPLPNPSPTPLHRLLTGTEDSQWVAVEAMVRSVESDDTHVVLNLASEDGTFTATLVKEDGADYASLVDCKAILRGVAAPLVDAHKRRMMGIRLLVPGFKWITVEDPPPPDPFTLPFRPLSSLLQYSAVDPSEHRIHVRGRVTLFWPGRRLCILQGDDGLCMETADRAMLEEGQLVDVVGFLVRENYEPTLSDAVVRPVGDRIVSPPKRISTLEAMKGEHNGELVQMEGRLIGKNQGTDNSALLLSSGDLIFPVELPPTLNGQKETSVPAWVVGSKLVVAGVLSEKVNAQQITRGEGVSQLGSFELLLRSAADVTIVETPSWWTTTHTLAVLGCVALVTLAVLCWVAVLRRRVEEQTVVIRRSEERFRHMAQHDALTGLAVRTVLQERLDQALLDAKRRQTSLALLMLDLDGFKQVNDTLGHAAGDEVLRTAGERIQASIRETDTLARIGGDEFTVLLPGVHGIEEARKIAAHLVASVSAIMVIGGREAGVSVSVGVTAYPEGGEDAASLMRNADIALYRAKASGRNCYRLFSPEMVPANAKKLNPEPT